MKMDLLEWCRCPNTKQPLLHGSGQLVNESLSERYPITPSGIPLFAQQPSTRDAARQQQHYDRVSDAYLENMTYPHSREYIAYLDRALLEQAAAAPMERVLDVCCGSGEGLSLFKDRIQQGVGVDISRAMLEAGRRSLPADRFSFIQADATQLPFRDDCFDTVMTFGGVHHVNNRHGLFSEIQRVLKPGGHFLWREPVNDFLPWRMLRAIIYRLSPSLDEETEHPVRWSDTVPVLDDVGLELVSWRTYGFIGFCLLMNSDILLFNRAFRFVPGIRGFTRFMAALDDRVTSLPGLKGAGLQVVGLARKPSRQGERSLPTRRSA